MVRQICPRVSCTLVVEDSSCCNIVGCNRKVVEVEPVAVVVDSTEVGHSTGTDSSCGEVSS